MFQPIPLQFLVWYLWDTPKKILKGWGNFLRFGMQFFSIPLLFKTLFAPWRGYQWSYGRGFDFGRYLEIFFSNMVTRIIGAVLRIILILVGLASELLILVGGLLVLITWLILPFLLIRIFTAGVSVLI